MLCIEKVRCDKEPRKQGPAGEKEHSLTRGVGRNVIFQLQMPQRPTYHFNIVVLSGNTLRTYFFMLKFIVSGFAWPLNPMPLLEMGRFVTRLLLA